MSRLRFYATLLSGLLLLLLAQPGCEKYDSPPQVSFPDAKDPTADVKLLPNPGAPLVLGFSEPIDPATLDLRVIRLELGPEGDLVADLQVFFDMQGEGGTGELSADSTRYTITLDTPLPFAQTLAVVIEPGLADPKGNAWKVQQILPFSYEFSCSEENPPSELFPSGTYFFMVDVEEPLAVQLRFWGTIEVDGGTGTFRGSFTDSARNPDLDCGFECPGEQICRLLPEPECVWPSTSIATVDEYPDQLPDPVAPTGFSFFVTGCVRDQPDGSVLFANDPVDVKVHTPPVTVTDTTLSSLFKEDEEGVLRGTGVLTSPDVLLGTNSNGAGVGTHIDRRIPDDEVPPGIPPLPAE